MNTNGAIVGPSYVVTWALGHLVTLAKHEEIDKIIIFSRAEKEQWEVKKYFNNPKLDFIIVDQNTTYIDEDVLAEAFEKGAELARSIKE